MTEQPAPPLGPPAESPAVRLPTVRLWTPTVIALVSVFLGFPGGLVLAAADWERMGLRRKAVGHLLLGGAASVPYAALWLLLRAPQGWLFVLTVNVAVAAYLGPRVDNDIARYKAAGYRVVNASALLALAIGVGTFAVWTTLSWLPQLVRIWHYPLWWWSRRPPFDF